jgi:hypothetical protein
MHSETNSLQSLAQRVGKGDRAATVAFRHDFARQMTHMVRRVMRAGVVTSPLDERIRAAVDQLSDPGRGAVDSEWVVAQVVRSLVESAIGRLQAGPRDGRRALETVCN